MTQQSTVKPPPTLAHLYITLAEMKEALSLKLSDASNRDKQLILSELAMWALKSVPREFALKGPAKTKIIRSFFGRYKSYER